MGTKRCEACGALFTPWPQVRNQKFCSEPACQRERRRRRQAEKRARDPAVRASDAQYFKDWAAKHPDYWKNYRSRHPEYVEGNRLQQHLRNRRRIAKDELRPRSCPPTGQYRLTLLGRHQIANEASWIVELSVLSGPVGPSVEDCK